MSEPTSQELLTLYVGLKIASSHPEYQLEEAIKRLLIEKKDYTEKTFKILEILITNFKPSPNH
jgi:hypothetical protein